MNAIEYNVDILPYDPKLLIGIKNGTVPKSSSPWHVLEQTEWISCRKVHPLCCRLCTQSAVFFNERAL